MIKSNVMFPMYILLQRTVCQPINYLTKQIKLKIKNRGNRKHQKEQEEVRCHKFVAGTIMLEMRTTVNSSL